MKLPIFGQRRESPAKALKQGEGVPLGHQVLLEELAKRERREPNVRLQVAGHALFETIRRNIESDRGTRIEDLLGILAAAGGFACIVGAIHVFEQSGLEPQQVGLVSVTHDNGETYYFGDLPNQALWEHQLALLSLTLGIAQAQGAEVKREMVEEVFGHVAETVGNPEFGIPRLPEAHTPGDLPINYVKYLWPLVRDTLDFYEVPIPHRATAIGFAVQQAILAGSSVVDPKLAAQIVVEYAVPMAKLDPAQFG